MCGFGGNAQAQSLPKPPPGVDPYAPRDNTPEPWDSVMRGLKDNEDPNPERFRPTQPLFPERSPPGKSDGESEDEKKRKRGPDSATPYLGS